jgi:hypothetical protein
MWRTFPVLCRLLSILAAAWSIALCSPAASQSSDPCRPLPLLEPHEATIADPRPAIRWQPLPGVQRYRVRLQSRVPEGELVASLDTVIEGHSFVPPRPLTSYRAVVTVVVTGVCEQVEPAGWSGRIFIDTGLGCRLGALEQQPGDAWTWRAAPGAIEYEVFCYAMPSGKLRWRKMTSTPLSVPLESEILAVRARCSNGFSDLQFAP